MTRGWLGATLGVVTVVLLVPLTVFLVASWLLGWQLVSVQTGSMSPTFDVGSLVVLGPVDPADVEVGMAIAFIDPADPGRLVTHRVVGLAPGTELSFLTKGDANATADPNAVPARLIRGRALWHITYLGTVMDWLQWPRSFLVLVVAPSLLLAVAELRSRRGRLRAEPLPA
ncbi:MAG TPA: signal peptidase I [Candidatus Limnocylindrales bacterium]|nr:signal peptidase I [Candidatus Limnocylindrales bacterium]